MNIAERLKEYKIKYVNTINAIVVNQLITDCLILGMKEYADELHWLEEHISSNQEEYDRQINKAEEMFAYWEAVSTIEKEDHVEHKDTLPESIKIEPYQSLQYLNLVDRNFGHSMIGVRVSPNVGKSKEYTYTIYISDCSNEIQLHGSLFKKKDRENAIHKIQTMRHELELLEAHLESQFDKIIKQQAWHLKVTPNKIK